MMLEKIPNDYVITHFQICEKMPDSELVWPWLLIHNFGDDCCSNMISEGIQI